MLLVILILILLLGGFGGGLYGYRADYYGPSAFGGIGLIVIVLVLFLAFSGRF